MPKIVKRLLDTYSILWTTSVEGTKPSKAINVGGNDVAALDFPKFGQFFEFLRTSFAFASFLHLCLTNSPFLFTKRALFDIFARFSPKGSQSEHFSSNLVISRLYPVNCGSVTPYLTGGEPPRSVRQRGTLFHVCRTSRAPGQLSDGELTLDRGDMRLAVPHPGQVPVCSPVVDRGSSE